jgi:tetratricopeptide (TPR) repeat protein
MIVASLLLLAGLVSDEPLSRLAAGDEAFYKMDYAPAVSYYATALEERPTDAGLLWRLARAYVCMAETLNDEERVELCKKAEAFAIQSIKADSTLCEGHTWRAAALGYLALDGSMGDQVRFTQQLLREVNIAIALNPNDDAAYSIKGSLFRAIGNVSWLQRSLASVLIGRIPSGGFADAEAALRKAIEIAPDVMRHQYELGILYIDMDRKEDARKALEAAALLPVRVAIDRPRLAKIKELLQQLSQE